MLAGRMRHGDNKGNTGLLGPGSVQWMTAGRGIVHSEMPEQEEGLMHGFQLWVNLPAKDKMTEPRYQDIAPERIPAVDAGGGVRVRVIAGRFGERRGAGERGRDRSDLSRRRGAGGRVVRGAAAGRRTTRSRTCSRARGRSAASRSARGELAVLGRGERFEIEAGPDGARLVLIAGRPLNEPVAKYGPFVMNTADEIRQAVFDYQSGKF